MKKIRKYDWFARINEVHVEEEKYLKINHIKRFLGDQLSEQFEQNTDKIRSKKEFSDLSPEYKKVIESERILENALLSSEVFGAIIPESFFKVEIAEESLSILNIEKSNIFFDLNSSASMGIEEFLLLICSNEKMNSVDSILKTDFFYIKENELYSLSDEKKNVSKPQFPKSMQKFEFSEVLKKGFLSKHFSHFRSNLKQLFLGKHLRDTCIFTPIFIYNVKLKFKRKIFLFDFPSILKDHIHSTLSSEFECVRNILIHQFSQENLEGFIKTALGKLFINIFSQNTQFRFLLNFVNSKSHFAKNEALFSFAKQLDKLTNYFSLETEIAYVKASDLNKKLKTFDKINSASEEKKLIFPFDFEEKSKKQKNISEDNFFDYFNYELNLDSSFSMKKNYLKDPPEKNNQIVENPLVKIIFKEDEQTPLLKLQNKKLVDYIFQLRGKQLEERAQYEKMIQNLQEQLKYYKINSKH